MDGKGGIDESGHSNRIFSVKFYIEDENKLVSGGWDNRLIGWDLRSGDPVQSIKGRMTVSDGGISVIPGEMLSCSYSEEKQLMRYDIQSFKKITNVFGKEPLQWEYIEDEEEPEYDEGEEEEDEMIKSTNLYCGCFSSNGQFILAGGAVKNEARIMTDSGKLIYRIHGLARPVICCDWNKNDTQFCLGGTDGYIRLYDIKKLPEVDLDFYGA